MKILVLGGGGREHALVWKIGQSPQVDKIYCIPGNAGISQSADCPSISLADFQAIASFVEEKNVDLTVVGPEQPLTDGIVDFLTARKHAVFGPDKIAAQMEGSKIFAKQLMKKYGIPTAEFAAFEDYSEARRYLDRQKEGPIVIKADGLAAGKGSVVCENLKEARSTLEQIMVQRQFSDAGKRVVIEEYMQGEEASLFVLTDGKDYVTLSPAQDYKRALDGDRGKNTGGMGSYAPTPFLTPQLYQQAIGEIVEPTLTALQAERVDYRGVLYCGLMLTREGPKVVEFNCRFGDPETQVVLPLLQTDLVELLYAVVKGELSNSSIALKSEYAVCVIAASGGYPDAYEKGKEITGLENVPEDVLIFHAGTRFSNHKIVTNGGRVLGVTALDGDLKKAALKVYQALQHIHFEKMHYRRDIAEKGWKILHGA
ncbi:MAG: phosphoribosylamine--glycine ligase [Calditrichia bacterium]